jgi:GWxTD domain-containing protein
MLKKILFCTLLVFLSPVFMLPQSKPKQKMSEHYRLWLEEEVIYIITAKERDIFKELQTDRERDTFIESFWKQRDPTPGTPRNEFKEEFYQRRQYANEYYGRGTPQPGWKTDQGRIYIILGPPRNIEDHSNINGVYPVQIWSYAGDPNYGLPTGFNIIFFKKHGMGEYVLYSPAGNGPESLIADWGTGLSADYLQNTRYQQAAYKQLVKLAPNLAYQTLSLIPGERVMEGTVSLASAKLIGNVFSYPHKKVDDQYAEALLKYKDIVEVEYTANFINSDSSVKVLWNDAGYYVVHYSVEPSKLSVSQYDDSYNAHFELNGMVSDLAGKPVFQYNKEIPLNFTQDQIQDLEAKSFALQDMFPLLAGDYNFSVLIKNTVSKEFTSIEKEISIPENTLDLRMSPLILGYDVNKSSMSQDLIPFKAGEAQILCQAHRTFTSKEPLVVLFQLLGLKEELKANGNLNFTVFKEEKKLYSDTKRIDSYINDLNFIEQIPLKDFSAGYYKIRVSLLNKEKEELLFQTEDFEITHAVDIPRPMIISKVIKRASEEEYSYTLGIQHLNKGDIQSAIFTLEKAYHKNPQEMKYALSLSQALFVAGQYQRVQDTLKPFSDSQNANAETLYFLGKSIHSLGKFDEAISYYQSYLSRFGANLEILNLLGTCYFKLEDWGEALKIWERSLEIESDQENIKKLVQSLREKIKRKSALLNTIEYIP